MKYDSKVEFVCMSILVQSLYASQTMKYDSKVEFVCISDNYFDYTNCWYYMHVYNSSEFVTLICIMFVNNLILQATCLISTFAPIAIFGDVRFWVWEWCAFQQSKTDPKDKVLVSTFFLLTQTK